MIKRWKRYFVIYWKIQLQNIKSLEQYRADFFMMLFFTTLSQACNLSVIGIIYSNIPSVGGWNMWDAVYGFARKSCSVLPSFCELPPYVPCRLCTIAYGKNQWQNPTL